MYFEGSKNTFALPGKTVRIMYPIQDASIRIRAFCIMKQKDSRVQTRMGLCRWWAK